MIAIVTGGATGDRLWHCPYFAREGRASCLPGGTAAESGCMIAIVTGSATGIGFGITRSLAAKGAQVACLEQLPRSPAA
jgi:hypothetical protein